MALNSNTPDMPDSESRDCRVTSNNDVIVAVGWLKLG